MQPQFPWKQPSDGGGCASQHAHNDYSVPSTLLTSADFAGRQGEGNGWTLKLCHTLCSGEDHQSFQKASYKILHKRLLKKLGSHGTRRKVLSMIRNGPRRRNGKKGKISLFRQAERETGATHAVEYHHWGSCRKRWTVRGGLGCEQGYIAYQAPYMAALGKGYINHLKDLWCI